MNPLIQKIAPRLRQCRKEKQLTIAELVKQLKHQEGYDLLATRYANWEHGSRMPSLEPLSVLARFFGKSPAWLCGLVDHAVTVNTGRGAIDYTVPDGYVRASIGTIRPDQASDNFAFSSHWLEAAQLDGRSLFLATATDDSMGDVIRSGDQVLIDTRARTVQGRDLFAMLVNGRVWFRWIRPEIDGSYTVITEDAEQYPESTINSDELTKLDIIGRVCSITKKR